MRTLALLAFIAIQEPAIDLEREARALREGSRLALITLIAQYPDGTPHRGVIQCAGSWFKHQEGPVQYGTSLPFQTDSRGAIVMNPALADEWIVCWAEHDGAVGKAIVDLTVDPAQVVRLTLRKDS